jgi:large repetitive protein
MKHFFKNLSLTTLSLALCSGAWAQKILQPSENCLDHTAADIVTFADSVLESKVREALSIGPQDVLTCDLAKQLTTLDASGEGARRSVSGSPEWTDPEHLFHDLSGIQNLTGLTDLALRNRGLSDISPLTTLTGLVNLNLHTNWITDISPLRGLTNLVRLRIAENPLTDISALSELTELRVLRMHRHGDFIGGQNPRSHMGATGILFTNAVTDIGPLANLTKLVDLNIHTQDISDLTPLSGLTSLIELRLAANSFTDLSPLRGLSNIQYLELTGNDITDITPLSGLTSLIQLDLRFNPELRNIQALFENPGIGAGDIVELRHTNVSCTDQARLAEKEVEVRTELFSSCATALRQR